MKRQHINLLISYAYMRELKEEQINWIFGVPDVNWLLDCGAFTALNLGKEIKLEDYMEFLRKWKHKLFGYIALDKLGDPKQTDINLNIMLKNGFKPVPVHVRGDKQDRMDYLFSISNLVALGGFRRPHRAPAKPEYIKQKMEWARGRNVHWLGYTNLPMLNTFRPYSCDSSSFSSARRWGRLFFYRDKMTTPIDFNYKEFMTERKPLWVYEIIEELGYSLADLQNSERWRGCREKNISSILTCYSYLRYSLDIENNIGTKYFIALTDSTMHELFRAFWHLMGHEYCEPERIPRCFM